MDHRCGQVAKKVVETVMDTAVTAVNNVVDVIPQWVKDAYEKAKEIFSRATNTIRNWCETAWSTTKRLVSSAATWLSGVASGVASQFRSLVSKAIDAGWRLVGRALRSIKHHVSTAWQRLKRACETVAGHLASVWNYFKQHLAPLVVKARDYSSAAWQQLKQICGTVAQHLASVWNYFKRHLAPLVVKARHYSSAAWQQLRQICENVAQHLTSVWKYLKQHLASLVAKARHYLSQMKQRFLQMLSGTWTSMRVFVAAWTPQWLKNFGTYCAEKIFEQFNWIRSQAGWLADFCAEKALQAFAWSRRQASWLAMKASEALAWTREMAAWLTSWLFFRSRALADIERFKKWGNSEVTGAGLSSSQLFDGEHNSQGISQQRLRHRSALQAVWQAGWMAWHLGWDPSLQLNLDGSSSEEAQYRQERAHRDYLQDHQRRTRTWTLGMAMASLVLGIAMACISFHTAGLSLVFFVQAFNAFLACASLLILLMQERVQQNTSLSEERRQQILDNLSLLQGILGMAGALTLVFDFRAGFAAGQVAGGIAAGAAQAVAVLRMSRMTGLVRAVMRLLGQATSSMSAIMRILHLPSLLRTVDRVLAVFGLNGARLAQLGMTSWTKIWVVILDLMNSFFSLMRSFMNLMQQQQQQEDQDLNEQEKEKESKQDNRGQASYEVTKTCEQCQMGNGEKFEWIEKASDLNAAVEEAEDSVSDSGKSNQRPRRSQASHQRLAYTPREGSAVEVWVEDGQLRSSRDLTESEQLLFGKIGEAKTEEDPRLAVGGLLMPY